MKFTNGMWLTKQGTNIQYPKEAYTMEPLPNGIRVFCPYTQIENRGNTLDGGLLTLTVTSPREDVLCVNMQNHMGVRGKHPQFTIRALICSQTERFIRTRQFLRC